MGTYFCYVHTPGVMTPHMRAIAVETNSDLAEAVGAAMMEWPSFEAIEVYDERDRAVIRISPRTGLIDH